MKTSFADKTNGKSSSSKHSSSKDVKKSKEPQHLSKHESPIKSESSNPKKQLGVS